MQKSGGKKNVVFRQISSYVSIIQPFRILIGRFQNSLNKALSKSGMLRYFKDYQRYFIFLKVVYHVSKELFIGLIKTFFKSRLSATKHTI